MTRAEALVLLIWCVPLASRLAREGIGTELTREDKITLNGFGRVWEAGWLHNPTIYHLTGLSRADIEILTAKMQMENDPQARPAAPEKKAAARTIRLAQNSQIRGFAEAKELFMAERFTEVLEKLYPLAAAYPDNLEVQALLDQSLRARREPSKLNIPGENPPEKPVRFPQRLALLLKGKGRAKSEDNSTTRSLHSTLLP